MITAVATVLQDPNGKLHGAMVGKLETEDGMTLLMIISNGDGFDEFKRVPLPFDGLLKLQANGTDGKPYSVPVHIPADAVNVTLRVGGVQVHPQDIVLPPAVQSFKPGSVLPAPPSRDQLCGVANHFQGIAVNGHHLFDPEIGWQNSGDDAADLVFRRAAYSAHLAVTLPDGTPRPDTHLCLSLDMTGLACLPRLKAIIREAIIAGTAKHATGFKILLMCMGDGNDEGEADHDPGALGYSWIMANFDAIVDYMEAGEDLTPWIVFCPFFDGGIPAWQPWTRVNTFLRMARARLDRLKHGPGAMAVEFSSGWWAWSGERDDLGTPDGQMIDVVLYEFPITWGPPAAPPADLLLPDGSDWAPTATNDQRAPWTQVWLINRFLGSRYVRPASQPPNYEAHPPHANGDTPRGPKFFIMWERTTYLWCRHNCDIAIVNSQTTVVRELGAEFY